MTARTYKAALIGAGTIAEMRHLEAIDAAGDRVRLAAVADPDLSRAGHLASRYGAAVHADADEMLHAEQPDLVLIATPPASHGPLVKAALRAGAWVLCEKPPVLSLAEYATIEAEEGEGGPYVGYVFQSRFGSAAKTLRQHVKAGTFGRPLVAVCNTLWYRPHAYFEVPWRGRWDTEGGGPTMGHGIHQMDLMLHLLGDWKEVRAHMATLDRRVETEDMSMAIVSFENGAVASVVNSLLSPRQTTYLRFDFQDATVELEHLYSYTNACWRWTAREGLDPSIAEGWAPVEDVASSHAAQLSDFLDSMDAGTRPEASGKAGKASLELITGLYASAITDRTVTRASLVEGHPFYDSLNGNGRYVSDMRRGAAE